MSADSVAAAAAALLGTAPEPELDAGLVRGAVEAAVAAGELQRRAHGTLGAGDVASKSARRDLVTRLDVESERAIVERLRGLRPGWAIEAEEEVHDDAGDAPRWFVDPLDGTVNFFHGLPLFCVSIGLHRGATPLLAVVHAPVLGETFVAARGAGAHSLAPGRGPRPLAVAATAELADAVLATGFPYRRSELEHSNLENFGRFFHLVRGIRRMGSAALDLAFVAAGRLDGFWELHLSPFDVAAGALLVREAGGEVSDAHGGDDWLRGGSIVAAPKELASLIRARVEA